MDTLRLLSASATPVVLISACGLVTLALYNRLGAIVSRIRSFQQQKLELVDSLRADQADEQRQLLAMLDSQIAGVTRKARVIQQALRCFLRAMAAFLLCSLFAGATVLSVWTGPIAVGAGLIGVMLFLYGLGWALRELTLSLSPLEEEGAYLEVVTAHRLAKLAGAKRLKVVESA